MKMMLEVLEQDTLIEGNLVHKGSTIIYPAGELETITVTKNTKVQGIELTPGNSVIVII
jgi:hypothetical protein